MKLEEALDSEFDEFGTTQHNYSKRNLTKGQKKDLKSLLKNKRYQVQDNGKILIITKR